MVGRELCIDRASFSSCLWRKAIQAPANPAVGSFLPQLCAAGAGAADPGFRDKPSGGRSLLFSSSSHPMVPPHLLGRPWPADQPGLAGWGRLAGSSQPALGQVVEEVALFPLGWCYQGPGWRHRCQWEKPRHPKSLWRPGAPLRSVPHLFPPNAVTFASHHAADAIPVYVVPTVLEVRCPSRDLLQALALCF